MFCVIRSLLSQYCSRRYTADTHTHHTYKRLDIGALVADVDFIHRLLFRRIVLSIVFVVMMMINTQETRPNEWNECHLIMRRFYFISLLLLFSFNSSANSLLHIPISSECIFTITYAHRQFYCVDDGHVLVTIRFCSYYLIIVFYAHSLYVLYSGTMNGECNKTWIIVVMIAFNLTYMFVL